MELQSPTPNRLSPQDLDRLLGGEDSAEVHALLEEWRASLREGDDPLVTLAAALNATFGVPPRTREDILWRASQILGGAGRAAATEVQRRRRGTFKRQPLRRGVWYGAVGLAIAVLGIIVGSNGMGRRSNRGRTTNGSIYTTTNGQRATITLPDGSTVALNVASHLEVPQDYAAGNRTVHLTGEAFFTVLHHTGDPFTVITGPTITRVLGTSFVVRRYATDSVATVAVRDGRVAVGATVVTAAQLVTVGPTGMTRVQPADGSMFSFTTGVLTLGRLPLSTAIPELNRWYDADVRLGDPTLANRSIGGQFSAGSLADLAAILEYTFHARVVRDGRVLTLFPG